VVQYKIQVKKWWKMVNRESYTNSSSYLCEHGGGRFGGSLL